MRNLHFLSLLSAMCTHVSPIRNKKCAHPLWWTFSLPFVTGWMEPACGPAPGKDAVVLVGQGRVCGWLSPEHRTGGSTQRYCSAAPVWESVCVLLCCCCFLFSGKSPYKVRYINMAGVGCKIGIFWKAPLALWLREALCTEQDYFPHSCWKRSRLLLQQAAAGAAVVMVMSLWRQAPCLRQWTVLVDAPLGKGHSQLSPLVQQMGRKPGLCQLSSTHSREVPPLSACLS